MYKRQREDCAKVLCATDDGSLGHHGFVDALVRRELSEDCLLYTSPSPELLERIKPMTMTQSAELFIRTFGLSGTPQTLAGEMNAMIEAHYRGDIPLKEGVALYLDRLRRDGVRMCVASATALPLMKACLDRLGVLDYFDFLLS